MSALGEVETALRNSDLGVNPTNNGDNLRVVLPSLTEERRKEYIKLARTKAEDGKIGRASCRERVTSREGGRRFKQMTSNDKKGEQGTTMDVGEAKCDQNKQI